MVAATIPRALHVASDSQGVVSKVQRLLEEQPPGPALPVTVSVSEPWGMDSRPNANDADLWHLAKGILRARGPGTTRITKVKAHLPKSSIEAGDISSHDWHGNQCADVYAGRASSFLSPDVEQAIQRLQAKRVRAKQTMHTIHQFMLSVLQGSEAPAGRSRPAVAKGRVKPGLIDPIPGQPLEIRRHTLLAFNVEARQAQSAEWEQSLACFIHETQWHECEVQVPWVLLMIAFECSCKCCVRAGMGLQNTLLTPRVDLGALVPAFKKAFMRALKATSHPDDISKFIPGSTGHHALKAIGICGCTSCLSAWPALNPELAWKVTESAMRLRHHLPGDWQGQLRKGELEVPWAQLSLKIPPRWRASLGLVGVAAAPKQEEVPWSVLCPAKCGHRIVLRDRPLREGTSWPKIRCPSCRFLGRCGGAKCTRCNAPMVRCRCVVAVDPSPGTG